jgi:nitrate reductase gamma subunit
VGDILHAQPAGVFGGGVSLPYLPAVGSAVSQRSQYPLTGILAYHQMGPYELMLPLHIALSETLLIVIPFSKLGHMLLFFFSRAFIGFELGARRGARSW